MSVGFRTLLGGGTFGIVAELRDLATDAVVAATYEAMLYVSQRHHSLGLAEVCSTFDVQRITDWLIRGASTTADRSHIRDVRPWDPLAHIARVLPRAIGDAIDELALPAGARVIDLGCADRPYRHLLPRDATYVGADLTGNPDAELIIAPDGRVPRTRRCLRRSAVDAGARACHPTGHLSTRVLPAAPSGGTAAAVHPRSDVLAP